jgi:hypothetical protein
VQQQLDKLMRDNRSNIDFDIGALNSVSTTLAGSRANLATTLCSLPAGVAGYFQTTSWGEWFNVRIVKFEVKDQNGKVITSAQEAPGSRSQKNPNPNYSCSGSPSTGGSNAGAAARGAAATNGKPAGGSGAPASGPSSTGGSGAGFEGLQSFVDSLLGKRDG